MFDNFADVEERRSVLKKDIQQVLETSMPENQGPAVDGAKPAKFLDPDKFMREVFDDKMEIESWVSTSHNMQFVGKALAESRPKHKSVAELVERFCPAWF